jgi:hypothetical protein
MKRNLFLVALAAFVALAFMACTPATEDTPIPHGPSFSGSITNSGAGGIAKVKVGVFATTAASSAFAEDNDLGKITPTGALTPVKSGTVTGAAYTTDFPVLSDLATTSGSTWNMVAWNDANGDGKLDVSEYNAMATVNTDLGVTAHTTAGAQDYFLSSIAYYPTPVAGAAGYRFKYYAVSGNGSDLYKEMDPAAISPTTGFNFKMNF